MLDWDYWLAKLAWLCFHCSPQRTSISEILSCIVSMWSGQSLFMLINADPILVTVNSASPPTHHPYLSVSPCLAIFSCWPVSVQKAKKGSVDFNRSVLLSPRRCYWKLIGLPHFDILFTPLHKLSSTQNQLTLLGLTSLIFVQWSSKHYLRALWTWHPDRGLPLHAAHPRKAFQSDDVWMGSVRTTGSETVLTSLPVFRFGGFSSPSDMLKWTIALSKQL